MLNMMRYGSMTPAASARFYALSREVTYDDGIEPTELHVYLSFKLTFTHDHLWFLCRHRYPTRNEVYIANSSRLAQIKAPVFTYNSEDWPGVDADDKRISIEKMKKLLDRLIALKEIELKVNTGYLVEFLAVY